MLSRTFERDPLRGAFPGDPLPDHDPAGHLALVGAADVFLIAPASANTLAKLAHGLADNLLTTAALAARCPVIVAPAMNERMWEHAATRANVALLRSRGVEVLEPGVGRLATHGEAGGGRLPEPAALLAAVAARPARGGWAGAAHARHRRRHARANRRGALRRQPLVGADGVRARRRGRRPGLGCRRRRRERRPSAPRRHRIRRRLDRRGAEQRLRGAVRPRRRPGDVRRRRGLPAGSRRRRQDRARRAPASWTVALAPTPDILAGLAARRRPGQTLVGFAAERGEGASRGRARSSRASASTRSSATTSRRRGSASTPSATPSRS